MYKLQTDIMDFSSLNPRSSNSLNIAARSNDLVNVRRLINRITPSCIDNRGWTCLHEAAAADAYECLVYILQHPHCRPLAETHEGHTALFVACRYKVSIKTIKALLHYVPDIANYGSTELSTPLHVVSGQGRLDVMELLIQHGAMINVQDFDGDTPLHDATLSGEPEAVNLLLHAGADPELRNAASYTVLHLASRKGSMQTVKYLLPFISDINQLTSKSFTPLNLATLATKVETVKLLLDHGADPHIQNLNGEIPLTTAVITRNPEVFKTLLEVTNIDKINWNIIHFSCKPHHLNLQILEMLLMHLKPLFFNIRVPINMVIQEKICDHSVKYTRDAPLNSYLNICEYVYKTSPEKCKEYLYLFLMNGVSVDARHPRECPPLVYLQTHAQEDCFKEVFQIFMDHGCNVDYCSTKESEHKLYNIPDAFLKSFSLELKTAHVLLPYSLMCEPEMLIKYALEYNMIDRIQANVEKRWVSFIGRDMEDVTFETLQYKVKSLKHLCRLKIRSVLREKQGPVKSTKYLFDCMNKLRLPTSVRNYLKYSG